MPKMKPTAARSRKRSAVKVEHRPTEATSPIKEATKLIGNALRASGTTREGKEAAREGGKVLRSAGRLLNTFLLPVNWLTAWGVRANHYIEHQLQEDLEQYTRKIPVEHRVEPSPVVAVPALQGLAYSFEYDELKQMYLGLLASAMDDRTASIATR